MKSSVVYDYQIFSYQKYGGISRYFYELATRISKTEKFKAKVLAPLYVNQYLMDIDPKLISGFSIPPIYKTVQLRTTINREISKLIFSHSCPNLVHETYYLPEQLAPKRAKTIITVHDMIPEKFAHATLSNDPASLFKAKAVARADCVICVSENTRKDLLSLFDVDPQKVFVTHLGCSLKREPQRQIQPIKPLRPYILYVGHRSLYKNFARLLKGYIISKDIKRDFSLICFGGLPFSQEEREQFLAHKLTDDQVQYVSGNDVLLASLYSNAAAFVYPSLYEGFGIPPLEAMACHCPVVCSDRSSIPEVVGDAAEFFDPYSPESIANAIENVVYSPERTQMLIQLGTERVKHFSWENCAQQTAAIYTSLL